MASEAECVLDGSVSVSRARCPATSAFSEVLKGSTHAISDDCEWGSAILGGTYVIRDDTRWGIREGISDD